MNQALLIPADNLRRLCISSPPKAYSGTINAATNRVAAHFASDQSTDSHTTDHTAVWKELSLPH